jgi:hypothetical protein
MRGRSFHSSTIFACDPLALTQQGTRYFLNFTKVNFVFKITNAKVLISLRRSTQLNLNQTVGNAALYSDFKFKFYTQIKKYAEENAKESSRKSLTQSKHDSNDTESLNLSTSIESPVSVSS